MMKETICPYCNKRKTDKDLHIEELGFKLNFYDLGTIRVDEYGLLNIECCSTCYYRDQKIKKYSKVLKWTSVSLFIISLFIIPMGYELNWDKYIDLGTILGLDFAISIILFLLSCFYYRMPSQNSENGY